MSVAEVPDEELEGDAALPEHEEFELTEDYDGDEDQGDQDAQEQSPVPVKGIPEDMAALRGASVSGLSRDHRIIARDRAVQAAFLGLKHAPTLHYTQGGRRWEGIDRVLKVRDGRYPNYADCSAFATWCLWNGLLVPFRVRDTVNGASWHYGYTGTQAQHGKRVVHHGNILRGDLALYGDPFGRTGHVAICIGSDMVISFGSERGPLKLRLNYRNDLRQIRRYI